VKQIGLYFRLAALFDKSRHQYDELKYYHSELTETRFGARRGRKG